MAQMVNVLDLLIPKKNEYVRGKIDRKNVVRIASAITGKDWPLPAITVRKLSKPVKRGKKEYTLAPVDGVHRTIVALATLSPEWTKKVNGWLKDAGLEPMPKGVKFEKIPADVRTFTDLEADVEQLRSNITHGLMLDKKKRGEWVKHLLTTKKMSADTLAKMLHMTKRSVYRMAKGEQIKDGPRKPKGSAKPKGESDGTKKESEPVWTAEGYLKSLRGMAREYETNKDAILAYTAKNGDGLDWLAKFYASLADVAMPAKA